MDPVYKNSLTHEEKKEVENKLLKTQKRGSAHYQSSEDPEPASKRMSIMNSLFASVGLSMKVQTSRNADGESVMDVRNDILMYNSRAEETQLDNPVRFWQNLKSLCPTLSSLALSILVISVTSVPSEQAFSASGRPIHKRRGRLSGAMVEKIMFLKDKI